MAKKNNTTEVNKDVETKDKFNPLDGDTIVRDYSAPQTLEAIDIPEPIFIPPINGVTNEPQQPTPRPKKTNQPVTDNPPPSGFERDNSFDIRPRTSVQVDDDEFEKMMDDSSSEELAEMLVDAYVTIKSDAIFLVFEITDEKLIKKSLKGKFNMEFLHVRIPIEEGKIITYKEYIDEYNAKIKEALTTPNSTQKKLRDLLAKILEKRGAKITPEQSLIYYLGKDLLMTTGKILQQTQTNNVILNYIQEVYSSQKREIEDLKRQNDLLKQQQSDAMQKEREKAKEGKVVDKKSEKIKDAIVVNDIEDKEEMLNL